MDDILSKIDPQLIGVAVTALLSYLGIRRGAEHKESLASTLKSALRAELLRLLDDDAARAVARRSLEAAAAAVLVRLNIKRSRTIDLLTHAAVEAALAELEERLFRLRSAQLKDATGKLAAGAQGVVEAFDAAKTSKFPKLGLTFEEVREPPVTVEQVYGNDPTEPALPGLDASSTAAESAAKVRAAIAAKDKP